MSVFRNIVRRPSLQSSTFTIFITTTTTRTLVTRIVLTPASEAATEPHASTVVASFSSSPKERSTPPRQTRDLIPITCFYASYSSVHSPARQPVCCSVSSLLRCCFTCHHHLQAAAAASSKPTIYKVKSDYFSVLKHLHHHHLLLLLLLRRQTSFFLPFFLPAKADNSFVTTAPTKQNAASTS